MGFATFHAHKSLAAKLQPRATPDTNCTTGGFYKSPSNGATINSLQPLLIEWDTTCIDSQQLDIHLLAPSFTGENTEITVWSGVTNSDGKKSVNIEPKWWNSTSEVKVQLAIVAAGFPPAMASLPAGPIFTATYTPPADGPVPPSASLTNDKDSIDASGMSKSLSGGKIAAAVIIPLLFVGLAIFAYLRYQRRKSSHKSKRFSQALDKRMSTISADWKSMSVAGAQAAIRSSMAINRDSAAFSFGNIRPSMDNQDVTAQPNPHMKQVRTGTGVGLRNPGAAAAIAAERASRVSRVSFADTVGRPSTDSRRTRVGLPSTYIPPVPSRKDVISGAPSVYPDSEIEKRMSGQGLSPRQTSGPLTLTPEDIQARMHGRLSPAPEKNEEYEEVMPALSMMRMSSTDDYLLPQPPPPTHASSFTSPHPMPSSPLPPSPNTALSSTSAFTLSAYTGQPSTPPVLSPDDMLRAYAVRKSSSPAPPPSSMPPQATGSPKPKGRKLSIRASLGMMRRERTASPMAISSPVQSTLVHTGSGPVTRVDVEAGAGAGMAGVGARYAVGGHENVDYEPAYGGVGRTN
ncbi:hypothetical protein J132_04159 [Termitomyces sp. J132]|nr:hypothetical protein H2248_011856 [Termitomyces sp. 'cryptogamus']KNZ77732.1 hypothetical protein J132_04159 [Termitomyces sp. J132]